MPHWIGVTSDSRWAYVTNENSNDVSVVDLADRTVKATVPVGNAPRKIVVQPAAASAGDHHRQVRLLTRHADGQSGAAGHLHQHRRRHPHGHQHYRRRDSGELQSGGGTFTVTLNQPGTYSYMCTIHPFMQGTVVVQ